MQRSVALTFSGAAALILLAISIYYTVRARNLSLPTPTIAHFLAIALPLAFPVIAFLFNRPVPSKLSQSISPKRGSLISRLPIISTAITILFMLDSALLAVSSAALEPSTFTCVLETHWHHLFRTKNEDALKRIQDALDCCGLKTVLHEPWPFPPVSLETCSKRYNRSTACEVPWITAGREVWGGMIGVATASIVIKALILILLRSQGGWLGQAKVGNSHTIQRAITGSGRDTGLEGQRYLDDQEETPDNDAEEEGREGQTLFASGLGQ